MASPVPQASRARRVWHRASGWPAEALLFLAMALWMCWPVPRFLAERALGDERDSLLNIQQVDHVQRALLDLRWGELLQAPIFYPHPDTLVWTEHLVGLAVLGLPLRLVSSNATVIYNLLTILLLALNGLAAAFLGRVLAGRGVGLAVGLFYGMAPARLAHLMHLQHEALFAPPLALALLVRFHRHGRRRDLLGAAALLVAQVVMVPTHAVYLPFLFALPALACVPALRRQEPRRLLAAGVLLVPLACVAWVSVAPYLHVSELYGYQRGLSDAVPHAATLKGLVTVDGHHDVAAKWMRQPTWGNLEETLWVGASLLTAALLGALLARYREKLHPAHPAVLLGCVLVTLFMAFVPHGEVSGVPYPGRWLWEHVRFLHLIRGFSRFTLFTLVALCALAALGLGEVHRRWPKAGWVTGALLSAACLVELYPGPARAAVLLDQGRLHPVYQVVQSQGRNGPYLELPYRLHGLAALHNHATTLHHGRTADGYSGFLAPLPVALRWLVNTLPMEPALSVVRQLGVRDLLLFLPGPRAAPDDTFPTLDAARKQGKLPPPLRLLGTAREGVALAVEPLAPGPWTFRELQVTGLQGAAVLPAEGLPATSALVIQVATPPRPNLTPQQRARVEVTGADGRVQEQDTFLVAPPILWSAPSLVSFQWTPPRQPGHYGLRVMDRSGVLAAGSVEVRVDVPHTAQAQRGPHARLEGALPGRMRPDHTVVVHLRVRNLGPETWLAHAGTREPEGRMDLRLGYRWPAGAEPQPELRVDLPHDVGPGVSVELDLPVRAPKKPGTYLLKVDVLRQLIAWAEAEGGTPLSAQVEVVEDPL